MDNAEEEHPRITQTPRIYLHIRDERLGTGQQMGVIKTKKLIRAVRVIRGYSRSA